MNVRLQVINMQIILKERLLELSQTIIQFYVCLGSQNLNLQFYNMLFFPSCVHFLPYSIKTYTVHSFLLLIELL